MITFAVQTALKALSYKKNNYNMKHFLPLCMLVLASFNATAQSSAGFEFTPDTTGLLVSAMVADSAAELEIHCTASAEITIKWQRVVVSMTPGCLTKVCDLNACYPETFNTKQFVMEPNQSGPISVHLVNNTGNMCEGVIRLDMWNLDDPTVIVPAFFLFNQTSSVNDIFKLDEVKVFPNPTTEYFTIENENVARVRMTTLDAREVAYFDATYNKTFSVAGQAAGMYVLIMEDAKGKAIGVAQLDVK